MAYGPNKRYPAGPITPHGAFHFLRDRIPQLTLRSWDDKLVFNMMGGLAIPDRTMPERVELRDLKGLIAPWQIIDQKGASQDGVTFVDALYDPIELQLDVEAVGRDPARLREVVRDLVAAVDIKRESELSWFTHDMGRWWAKVRWYKPPDDSFAPINNKRQRMSLRLRADTGFWQTYPHVDSFQFGYTTDVDEFDYLTADGDPITGWTTAYSGSGSGHVYTNNIEAISSLQGGRTAVCRRTDYTAGTDNPVVEIQVGTNSQWNYPSNTFIDIWIRMNNTGTPGDDGIRCRLSDSGVKLSSFSSSVETVIRDVPWPGYWYWFWYVPGYGPQPGETFKLVSGVGDDPHTYTLYRNNGPVLTVTDDGTSITGSSHRKAGFGMSAASTIRPLGILKWSVGDQSIIAQEGFVERLNVGDQPMWDRYLCIGPGMFSFANGAGSTEMVRFGPLLKNQIMQVRTHPGSRGVVDMTVKQPTQQEVGWFQQALADLFTFITLSRGTAFGQMIESMFGIQPPQGNPYAMLDGRFSVPIPPKYPGQPATPYHVKVSIDDGSAESQIIAAGTPLRRIPY